MRSVSCCFPPKTKGSSFAALSLFLVCFPLDCSSAREIPIRAGIRVSFMVKSCSLYMCVYVHCQAQSTEETAQKGSAPLSMTKNEEHTLTRRITGKTIGKLIGAFFALAYLAFCLYAGVTGKFPNMHETEHVMRFGELKNWVGGGMAAIMIAALLINSALNDWNPQKKRKLPFWLIMILPIILLLLLEAYLDIGWIGIVLYAGITALLFGIAWLPQLLNQWIARRLLHEGPMSGKQQVQIIEWIHFYPLKKLLIFGLWGFGVVLLLRGVWVTATGKIELDGGLVLFLLGTAVLVVALFRKMRRYVCTPYRNIPLLNQILSKNQLEQLLEGERWEPVPFEDAAMKQSS